MLSEPDSVALFRHSAPYINAHRGKTFVLVLSGECIAASNFSSILHDIALLNSLGVRLVLVHGARAQINQRLAQHQLTSQFHLGQRITDRDTLQVAVEAVGAVRAQLEAGLTTGLPNSPMHGAQIRVCSGNLVIARPLGVQQGVDYEFSGQVRRIDVAGVNDHLNDGSIVLLSPLGYSSTGEMFNLAHEQVARHAAIALGADKLLFFVEQQGLLDQQGNLLRSIAREQLDTLCQQQEQHQQLLRAISASLDAGVTRCHCISYQNDGSLLQELFTRDGSGSMLSQRHYEQLRQANIHDVGGILALISPLEQQGVLVKRSRDMLEQEIEQFYVLERDGMIVACAALYPYTQEKMGEIACVVTHPQYRGKQRAERLLQALAEQGRKLALNKLFVLTTVTAHWFREQGFEQAAPGSLPSGKQQLYNFQRNSKVFVLDI